MSLQLELSAEFSRPDRVIIPAAPLLYQPVDACAYSGADA
jgi:hypothetical protein